jgi:UDP-N-acetylmuramoyl-tripeptide--D-alanyl-D-alanine ligase
MAMLASKDLVKWTGGRWENTPPERFLHVSSDTRTIQAGDLFIALRGQHFDGHKFAADAFSMGAGAAMVDETGNIEAAGRPLLRVRDTLQALRNAAHGYRRQVGLHVVGVTGSAGKSTVKEMLAAMLCMTEKSASTRGNWNNEIGLSLSLLGMDEKSRNGVFEIGTNRRGEIADLCGILAPDWGVITNVGPVHIENFGTEEAIAEEKGCLLKALPVTGLAVLNRDGQYFEKLRDMTRAQVVTIGTGKDAEFRFNLPDSKGGLLEIQDPAGSGKVSLSVHQPGRHNCVNAALAAAAARHAGVSWADIQRALESVKALPMRWEEKQISGRLFINDAYNANPLSMRAALDTFSAVATTGRKWLVLSGMLELGIHEEAEHRDVGKHAAGYPWAGLIVTGALGGLIADGAVDAGFSAKKVHRCRDQAEAADLLTNMIQAGDAVLLKASRGMRLEKVIEGMSVRLAV